LFGKSFLLKLLDKLFDPISLPFLDVTGLGYYINNAFAESSSVLFSYSFGLEYLRLTKSILFNFLLAYLLSYDTSIVI